MDKQDDEYTSAWREGEEKPGGAEADTATPLVDAVKKAAIAAEGSTPDETNEGEKTAPSEVASAKGEGDDEYVRAHRELDQDEKKGD